MRAPLVTVVVALCAGACAAPHPPYWVVEKNGKRGILLGTMHAEADVSVLAPELFDELRGARVLVTEADVRHVDPGEFDALIALPDGETVPGAVSSDDWNRIQAALLGIVDLAAAAHEQPWFLESQAVVQRLPPVAPIDASLVERAAGDGVKLDFFETWQDQVQVLNGVGFDDGIAALVRTAKSPEAAVSEHLRWADAYRAGDVDEMTALAFDPAEVKARPDYYRDVVNRHADWLPKVEAELDGGDAFIAAGFMHMLTERGLPALLAKDGYTVTLR